MDGNRFQRPDDHLFGRRRSLMPRNPSSGPAPPRCGVGRGMDLLFRVGRSDALIAVAGGLELLNGRKTSLQIGNLIGRVLMRHRADRRAQKEKPNRIHRTCVIF